MTASHQQTHVYRSLALNSIVCISLQLRATRPMQEEKGPVANSVRSFQLTFSADAMVLNGGQDSESVTRDPSGTANATAWTHQLTHCWYKARLCHFRTSLLRYVPIFYGPLQEGISISIPLHGFVQTRAGTSCENSAMQYWIPAAWTPVPGGWASFPDYKEFVRQSKGPNDSLTGKCVFQVGGLSLNNAVT